MSDVRFRLNENHHVVQLVIIVNCLLLDVDGRASALHYFALLVSRVRPHWLLVVTTLLAVMIGGAVSLPTRAIALEDVL